MPPAMADSIPLHEARRVLWSAGPCGLLASFPWPPGPRSPLEVRLHPPSQVMVESFSELDTQSLIVRFLSPAQGFASHDDEGVFEDDAVAPVCSFPDEKLELLPMDMLPVELPPLKLSFSEESFLLASRSAAATSILSLFCSLR